MPAASNKAEGGAEQGVLVVWSVCGVRVQTETFSFWSWGMFPGLRKVTALSLLQHADGEDLPSFPDVA